MAFTMARLAAVAALVLGLNGATALLPQGDPMGEPPLSTQAWCRGHSLFLTVAFRPMYTDQSVRCGVEQLDQI